MIFNIRKAKKNDAKIVDEIYCNNAIEEEKRRFSRVKISEIRKDFNFYENSRRQNFIKNISSKKIAFFVVEVEREVIGFGEGFVKKSFIGKIGVIDKVYINKNFRKKGIGLKISKFLMKELKGMGADFFEWACYTSNEGSMKLAEKLGMKVFSVRYRRKA
jgi:RimJ/RimL family protein N-acetyltransferase